PTKFNGAVGGTASAIGARPSTAGQDIGAVMERIDALGLPLEEERALKAEVRSRFAQDDAIDNARKADARDAALTILNQADAAGRPLTRESAIPGAIWDSLSPSDAMAIRADIRRNAEPKPKETDMGTFLALSDLYATDPA